MKISNKVTVLAVVAVLVAFSSLDASATILGNIVGIDCPKRVPDAGTMMPLLGMSLIAVDAIRRKLKA